MKKYLIGLSLISGLLLAGCSEDVEKEKEKDVIVNEEVVIKSDDLKESDKESDKESGKESDKESGKESDKGVENSTFNDYVEGHGSIKEALKEEYSYDDEQFNQIINIYANANYNYENYIPGETEKINFYKENAVLHGEEKSQKENVYLIYFFSPTCIYCNEFYSTLVDYSKKDNAYPMYKLNVDILENYFSWQDYNLSGTPSLVLYDKENDKILNTLAGVQSLDTLPVLPK